MVKKRVKRSSKGRTLVSKSVKDFSSLGKKENDKKLYAFLATFLSIIGFVIALVAKRDDKYVMFYAKNSLVVFCVGAVAGAIGMIIYPIPIMGSIIQGALTLLTIFLWVLTWVFALSGEVKEIPIISDWADKLKI